MTQGNPDNPTNEQLPIPNPVRDTTLSLLSDAQEIISTTGCDVH